MGRAALTIYHNNPSVAYLGFFEADNNHVAVSVLLASAEQYALSAGCGEIVGPINASFWLGYRMKADRFDDKPYFSEPYNLPYYRELWQNNGYHVCHEYVSNHYYKLSPDSYRNPKFEMRHKSFLEKGYVIKPIVKQQWDKNIREVYGLISRLYSSFPGFSYISEEDFTVNYAGLKTILNFSLCRLAYYRGTAVGFAITVPDYGTDLNNLSYSIIPKILWKRSHSRRYVVLYIGVEQEHNGLGTAMMQDLLKEAAHRHIEPIGALIHRGKVTQGYASDIIKSQSTYLLLHKSLHPLGSDNIGK